MDMPCFLHSSDSLGQSMSANLPNAETPFHSDTHATAPRNRPQRSTLSLDPRTQKIDDLFFVGLQIDDLVSVSCF